MRIVSVLFIFLSLSPVSAQEEATKNQQQEKQKIPTTLSEAHAELERIFSAEDLAEIDGMPSEDDMIQYHMPFGTGLRNSWGLWQGSPLGKHMEELGFTHPDDMSGVILGTFWCKRHGQDFRLKERAAAYKRGWEAQQRREEDDEKRIQKAKAAMRDMMMGLRFEKRDVPTVRIPVRYGMSVRFMCPFRDGVFLTAHRQWPPREGSVLWDGYYVDPASGENRRRPDMDDSVSRGLYLGVDREVRRPGRDDNFYTPGLYLDLKDRKIHMIRVEEVNEVYAAVVAGDRAWFAGLTNGRAVLTGVDDHDRVTVPLPQVDEIPDLGLDGESLLAVYSKTIYRLTDRQWSLVHSGDILLPRSGSPPQRHGNMVFLRDEGGPGDRKRLWWLTMGKKLHLHLLDRDTGLGVSIVTQPDPHSLHIRYVGPPGWQETSSYCVTSSGDLWACLGSGSYLLRRSQNGSYAVAIENHSVQFTGDWFGTSKTDPGLFVSAVTALPDDTLLLEGYTGLYRLKGNELIQELAFAPQGPSGKAIGRYNWKPNNVIALDDRSYFIGSASRDGAYLLRKGDDDQWSAHFLGRGDPIVW